jgi:hypothetical protein
LEEKMKLNMNVEELRREILEGARAVPLAQGQKEVGGRSEKGRDAGRECEGEDEESSYTKVGDVAAEVEGGEVSLEEVSLESGVLVYFSEVLLK